MASDTPSPLPMDAQEIAELTHLHREYRGGCNHKPCFESEEYPCSTIRLLATIASRDEANKEQDKALDEVMAERDHWEEQIARVYTELGGEGEWCARIPSEPPPNSGDLSEDAIALARQMYEENVTLVAQAESLRSDLSSMTLEAKNLHRLHQERTEELAGEIEARKKAEGERDRADKTLEHHAAIQDQMEAWLDSAKAPKDRGGISLSLYGRAHALASTKDEQIASLQDELSLERESNRLNVGISGEHVNALKSKLRSLASVSCESAIGSEPPTPPMPLIYDVHGKPVHCCATWCPACKEVEGRDASKKNLGAAGEGKPATLETCPCAAGVPGDYEGPLRGCLIHGAETCPPPPSPVPAQTEAPKTCDVYSREECPFHYCASPDLCCSEGRCISKGPRR
jgi:hypothetical protein